MCTFDFPGLAVYIRYAASSSFYEHYIKLEGYDIYFRQYECHIFQTQMLPRLNNQQTIENS